MEAEQRASGLLGAEHGVLERLFPRHIIEHMASDYQHAVDSSKSSALLPTADPDARVVGCDMRTMNTEPAVATHQPPTISMQPLPSPPSMEGLDAPSLSTSHEQASLLCFTLFHNPVPRSIRSAICTEQATRALPGFPELPCDLTDGSVLRVPFSSFPGDNHVCGHRKFHQFSAIKSLRQQ